MWVGYSYMLQDSTLDLCRYPFAGACTCAAEREKGQNGASYESVWNGPNSRRLRRPGQEHKQMTRNSGLLIQHHSVLLGSLGYDALRQANGS